VHARHSPTSTPSAGKHASTPVAKRSCCSAASSATSPRHRRSRPHFGALEGAGVAASVRRAVDHVDFRVDVWAPVGMPRRTPALHVPPSPTSAGETPVSRRRRVRPRRSGPCRRPLAVWEFHRQSRTPLRAAQSAPASRARTPLGEPCLLPRRARSLPPSLPVRRCRSARFDRDGRVSSEPVRFQIDGCMQPNCMHDFRPSGPAPGRLIASVSCTSAADWAGSG
jgi:hypothetical protein